MIPERQLSTWANLGAETSAQATYASIKAALNGPQSRIRERPYEIYLQGSYRNSTNIYGDSDVDIVVESGSSFAYDLDGLSDAQKASFHATYPNPASYRFEQFRDDVAASLITYYGSALVTLRNKCIQVAKQSGRLNADVVPCQGYRRYVVDPAKVLPGYYSGIGFYTRNENRLVVNYPKLHHEAGVLKNQASDNRYKPTVRIFKNLRNYLSAEGKISATDAASYFVECLIFNAPPSCFKATHFYTVLAVLVWLNELLTGDALSKLVCGNQIVWLFGDTPEQWRIDKAKAFIKAVLVAWNNWDK
jgi:hypothetical protein